MASVPVQPMDDPRRPVTVKANMNVNTGVVKSSAGSVARCSKVMKRLEMFTRYLGMMGTRVHETFEVAFCEMLGALGLRYIAWGFGM